MVVRMVVWVVMEGDGEKRRVVVLVTGWRQGGIVMVL